MITPCTLQKGGIATPQTQVKYVCITAMADNDNTNKVTCNNFESNALEHLPLSLVVPALLQQLACRAHSPQGLLPFAFSLLTAWFGTC